jgi:hypothetical protein
MPQDLSFVTTSLPFDENLYKHMEHGHQSVYYFSDIFTTITQYFTEEYMLLFLRRDRATILHC